MWIWRTEYERILGLIRDAQVAKAKFEAQAEMLREQVALIIHSLEVAEKRNGELFDTVMQLKHQHPGTGFQKSMMDMMQGGETLLEEDPEELRKYHSRMQQLQDQGMDPGLVLLEDMDELRSESDIYGPELPDGS